jgi:hypothetical protein
MLTITDKIDENSNITLIFEKGVCDLSNFDIKNR